LEGKLLYTPETVSSVNSLLSKTENTDPTGDRFPKYFIAASSEIATSFSEVAALPDMNLIPIIPKIEGSANPKSFSLKISFSVVLT
jgi:hypothetical protein